MAVNMRGGANSLPNNPPLKIDPTKKIQQGQPMAGQTNQPIASQPQAMTNQNQPINNPSVPKPAPPQGIPPQNISKPNNSSRVNYGFAGKTSWLSKTISSIPDSAHPTKRAAKILSGIFLIVVLIATWQFIAGLGILSASPNIDRISRIGVPFIFLELKITDPENNSIRYWSMIGDLLIWIFLAYLIDIVFNMIINMRILKSEEEKKMIPQMYKARHKSNSISGGLTKAVFKDKTAQISS